MLILTNALYKSYLGLLIALIYRFKDSVIFLSAEILSFAESNETAKISKIADFTTVTHCTK